jgi:hypothetical protein
MEVYYSSEQPQLLDQYQSFEQERIEFMRSQFSRFLGTFRATNIATVFNSSCDAIDSSVQAIDTDGDITQWAQASGKKYAIPEPIPYLTYDIEGGCAPELSTTGRRAAGGSSDGSSPAPRRPAASPISASLSPSSSLPSYKSSSKKFDPSKYNIPDNERNNPKKFQSAVKKMMKIVDDDLKKFSKDIMALEKLLPMYDKDPAGRSGVESEMGELRQNIEQLEFIKNDLQAALAEGNGNADEETAGGAEQTKAHAAYEYSATNDTELSFSEGDELVILQKDDSGWWFASFNGNEGFVPANYMI